MRFAWQREKLGKTKVRQSTANRVTQTTYNTVYWIPIILPFTPLMDYNTGFIAFALIVLGRGVINLITNNVLAPERAEYFPLRGI